MNPQSELALIRSILEKVDTPITSEEILSFALQGIKDSFDCLAVAIVLLDPAAKTFKTVISKGWSNEFVKKFHAQPFEGLVRDMAERDKPEIIAPGDPRYHAPGYVFQHPYKSALAIPMGSRGRKVGFLYLSSSRADAYREEATVAVLRDLANLCSLVLDYGTLGDQVLSLSRVDPLTGLSNYVHWHAELHREITRAEELRSELSLMEIRVNHFKEFNSALGHVKGDKVLREISAMIKGNLGEMDVPCRVGGKWFVVLVGQGAEAGRALGRKILDAMTARPPQGDPPLTLSIGLSAHIHRDPEAALIRRAEEGVLEARRKGGNSLVVR